jgi:hypothetical protein
MNFYEFYKIQQNSTKLYESTIAGVPGKFLLFTTMLSFLTHMPLSSRIFTPMPLAAVAAGSPAAM